MRLCAVVVLASGLGVSASCFDPAYNCRIICDENNHCPPGFHCIESQKLCAHPEVEMCRVPDAGADTRPEAMPPPDQLCYKDQCYTVAGIKDGLVLWLDPSNLPAPGTQVTVWRDRSGSGNDALPGNDLALPTTYGEGLVFSPNQNGSALRLVHHPSLDFGSGDFLVLVVAAVSTSPTRIFTKSDGDRMNPKQVVLAWAYDTSLTPPQLGLQGLVNGTTIVPVVSLPSGPNRLFGIKREQDHAEIRVNGIAVGSADVAADASTNTVLDAYIGQLGSGGTVADSVSAAVIVRGAIDASDVAGLERFLARAFGIGL